MSVQATRVLIFGATGAAGQGTLRASLNSKEVSEVRVIVRRDIAPDLQNHPKVRVFKHEDFLNFDGAIGEVFENVDSVLYCLGIGINEVSVERYRVITQDFPLAAATKLKAVNPKAIFGYVSGKTVSTDSWFAWSRIKAEAEDKLMSVTPTFSVRPALIDMEIQASWPLSRRIGHAFFRPLFLYSRSMYITNEDLGYAMLAAAKKRLVGDRIDNAVMRDLADEYKREFVAGVNGKEEEL